MTRVYGTAAPGAQIYPNVKGWPHDVLPAVADAWVSAGWATTTLTNDSDPRVLAALQPLVWRGSFNPQGFYAVGHLVRAGSQLYVCTDAPSKVLDTRVDTFERANQAGWGTASDGHVWTADGHDYGLESISGNRGLASADSSGNTDELVLGPPMRSSDIEALMRWQMTVSAGGLDGLAFYPSFNGTIVNVNVFLDGTIVLSVNGATPSPQPTWAGGDSAHSYWTRVHIEGGTFSVRTWQDGTTEPSPWDGGFAYGQSTIPGSISLGNPGNYPSTTLAVDHLSVSMLAEEVPWPSLDLAHWALMAG